MSGHGALAFDVAADIEVGDRYHEMRAGVVMAGDGRAGLQFDLGDAHAILHEHDVLRAAGEDVQAAFFVPCGRRRFAGGFVLQEFDGDVAERGVGEIAGDVGEVAGDEADFAILQFEGDRRLAFDVVFDFRGSEGDEDVVVVMGVHQRSFMRSDLYVEDADVSVFEREVVMGLGGEIGTSEVLCAARATLAKRSAGSIRRLLMSAEFSIVRLSYSDCRDLHDLDFAVTDLGKLLVFLGAGIVIVGAGARSAGPNQPSDRTASRRHCLSREEHDFLFSAGDFDCGQRGVSVLMYVIGRMRK